MSHERKSPDLVLPDDLTEAVALMERLSADCNHVRGQVDAARAEQKATGRYADPRWFQRAQTALRWKNRDRQRLQDHIATLRRRERMARGEADDRALIEVLRKHVGEEVFQECCTRARWEQETVHD